MGMTAIKGGSYSGRVISRLSVWPTLRTGRAQCGVGVGVSTGSQQIMHLHSAEDADLRLTRPVIDRLRAAFDESGQVQADPEGDWVSVRLESDHDVDLLLSLVSVAIQANTESASAQGLSGRWATSCRTGGVRVGSKGDRLRPPIHAVPPARPDHTRPA